MRSPFSLLPLAFSRLSSPTDDDYPDGGSAWLVVAGGWCVSFVGWGYVNSFGVLLTWTTQHQLADYSSSSLAWIGAFQLFANMAFAILSGRLFDQGYCKHLLVAGLLVYTAGYAISPCFSLFRRLTCFFLQPLRTLVLVDVLADLPLRRTGVRHRVRSDVLAGVLCRRSPLQATKDARSRRARNRIVLRRCHVRFSCSLQPSRPALTLPFFLAGIPPSSTTFYTPPVSASAGRSVSVRRFSPLRSLLFTDLSLFSRLHQPRPSFLRLPHHQSPTSSSQGRRLLR